MIHASSSPARRVAAVLLFATLSNHPGLRSRGDLLRLAERESAPAGPGRPAVVPVGPQPGRPVDAGDFLGATGGGERSRRTLEACAAAGYDALAVGDQELSAGLDALPEYRDRFRLIAQNLGICTAGNCLIFSGEPLVLERAGETVGLFALLDPRLGVENAKLVPPEVTARSMVRQLTAREVDWVIVLFHGPLREAEKLAREAPGIHAIIVGHEQRLVPPRRIGMGGDALATPTGSSRWAKGRAVLRLPYLRLLYGLSAGGRAPVKFDEAF